jgi:hypothetical protein
MHAINGKFKNGQVVLDEIADWPEDMTLRVEPISHEATLGIRDEDWPNDPEGIPELMALVESLEPFEMTAEEEANWKAARQAQNDYYQANVDERIKRMQGSNE